MSRRIVTTKLQSTGSESTQLDGYFDRVLKYVPSDVIAAWVAATGMIAAAGNIPNTVLWVCFVFGLIVTALWTQTRTKADGAPPALMQIVISTFAFAVWVFALGGPFEQLSFYNPVYGSLLLIGFSLVAGMMVPTD